MEAISLVTNKEGPLSLVFDMLDEGEALPLARDILKWIQREKRFEFTHRECLRKFRRVKKAGLQPALKLLIENDYLQEKEVTSISGPPSIAYIVLVPPE